MDDLEQIRRLVALYGPLLDSGRLADWGELFTVDATFSVQGRTYRSRAEIVREIGGMQPGAERAVKHLLLVPLIDLVSEDAALAWTDMIVLATGSERQLSIATMGRYHDRLLCAEGRWRFRERVLVFAGEPLPEGVEPIPAR